MYNNEYEEYMRNVLGYNNNNIYQNTYIPETQAIDDDINMLYPEIYNQIYPMICKICGKNMITPTKEIVEQMTEEIYINFEATDLRNSPQTNTTQPLKNGDVRNPNAKEISKETRQNPQSNILRDLIRILILRRFIENRRPQHNYMPPPPIYNRPMQPHYGPMPPNNMMYRNENNLFY